MTLNPKDFRIGDGAAVDSRQMAGPASKPAYQTKAHYRRLLAEHVARLSAQQQLLYASNRYAVPLDISGHVGGRKDGIIKHVMSGR